MARYLHKTVSREEITKDTMINMEDTDHRETAKIR